MDVPQFWIISVIGPAILLIVLIWLVMRGRSSRTTDTTETTEAGTREVYREEEQRRREGTDQAEK